MSALCVATATAMLSWATSSFTLSWTHSVEKTEWQESWTIEDDALVLKEARVKGSGAGMDPGEDAQLIDGWWVWQPALPPLPSLSLSASGATVSPWTLCVANECMALGEEASAAVRLWSCDEKARGGMVYMEDPFGNIFEIYSHSYELNYSVGAYGSDAN